MIERPTERWRRDLTEQEAAVAAGRLPREQAYAIHLWPSDFTATVDAVLATYEQDVGSLPTTTDDAVWPVVERVVTALNEADDEGRIETGEREELCEYIDQVLTAAGIDVAGLTARRGVGRHELTDEWRDW